MTTTLRVYDANNILRRRFEAGGSVQDLVRLYNNETSFWVFDGAGATQRRRDLYPGYKAKRDRETPEQNGAYDFLRTVKDELLPHCQNTIIMQAAGWEADDLIGEVVRDAVRLDSWDVIEIHSNDADLFQLCALSDKVKLMEQSKLTKMLDPADVRLYKCMVGDSSDNIPGIKGFGEKAWETVKDRDKLFWKRLFEGDDSYLPWMLRQLKPSQQAWVQAGGLKDLRTYWTIVGLLPVPASVMQEAMKISVFDPREYGKTCNAYLWS